MSPTAETASAPAAPLISIVIPCYKGERFLAETIESCLNQTVRDLEVIVVDDASPDGCAAIAERYAARDPRVRLVRRERNGGVSRAYNSGFAVARGTYFSRLSQDDLFRPDAMAIMLDRLRSDPDVGLVYCDMQKVDEQGNVLSLWRQSDDPENALFPTQEIGLCVLWRRTVHEAVGPFRPLYDFSEDYDFYLRISRQFRFGRCGDEAPFFFRCHPAQNGQVGEVKQKVNYARAQLSHHWAMARRFPSRVRHWKGMVGCSGRCALWSLELYWKQLRARRPAPAR
ncbi:MAG: glycosyltransferase [Isosphaeraceae bacterium]